MSSKSDKIALTVRVPNSLYYRLRDAAAERGMTHNAFVCGVLSDATKPAPRPPRGARKG